VKFPVRTSRTQVILLSFLSGLTIDLFTNTPGMHAAACSLIGFMRRPLVRAFADRELEENTIPSYYTFGTGAFMRYVVALTVIHHLMLFLIESVSLFDPAFLLLRISASVVLTSLCIFVVESFNVSRKRGEF
jgi:rod shape-determining protein MreD